MFYRAEEGGGSESARSPHSLHPYTQRLEGPWAWAVIPNLGCISPPPKAGCVADSLDLVSPQVIMRLPLRVLASCPSAYKPSLPRSVLRHHPLPTPPSLLRPLPRELLLSPCPPPWVTSNSPAHHHRGRMCGGRLQCQVGTPTSAPMLLRPGGKGFRHPPIYVLVCLTKGKKKNNLPGYQTPEKAVFKKSCYCESFS